MTGMESFPLSLGDYAAFGGYFAVLSAVGFWAGRREKVKSDDYFLAGRSLPWYVVGCSFIASNISSEHFIGMIGAACIYGVCAAMFEWGNVLTFSILVWFFIPFLLASKVFTAPEFMERRFNFTLREAFAVATLVTNVLAFLAAVLYGGGLALNALFGWPLWLAIVVIGLASGVWAIWGGLKSTAWMDVFTVVVMLAVGLMVTLFGLASLSEGGSITEGFRVMLERNQARSGVYAEAVAATARDLAGTDQYNRLSVIQPSTHQLVPWNGLLFIVFSVSIWYNVINQFMIQRVLGAKDMYHARMGIVLAGYLKIILPVIVVLPGLILFARNPEILLQPTPELIRRQADRGYVHMLALLIPAGLRGLFLAALFGAIQSTVQAVLNSSSTVFTCDIYQRLLRPRATERTLVAVGRIATAAFLALAMVLAWAISRSNQSLFEYIQHLYAFFAPPFGAIFLLGILWRRINGPGATAAVFGGFALSIAIKAFLQWGPGIAPGLAPVAAWLSPFMTQAMVAWIFSVVVCIAVSLATALPRPEQVGDDLTFNWRKINITTGMGHHWYSHVLVWWGLFVLIVAGLMVLFSGQWL